MRPTINDGAFRRIALDANHRVLTDALPSRLALPADGVAFAAL